MQMIQLPLINSGSNIFVENLQAGGEIIMSILPPPYIGGQAC